MKDLKKTDTKLTILFLRVVLMINIIIIWKEVQNFQN